MAATRDQTAKARLTRIILVMMQRIGIAHHRREQPYRFNVEDQALLKRFANFKGTRWRRPISVHDQAPQVRSSSAFPKYDYIRWPHRFSSVDEWVLVDVVDGGQDAIFEFLLGSDPDRCHRQEVMTIESRRRTPGARFIRSPTKGERAAISSLL